MLIIDFFLMFLIEADTCMHEMAQMNPIHQINYREPATASACGTLSRTLYVYSIILMMKSARKMHIHTVHNRNMSGTNSKTLWRQKKNTTMMWSGLSNSWIY